MHNFRWKTRDPSKQLGTFHWGGLRRKTCSRRRTTPRGGGGREGGMKTWRESLIPDNNAIRINRRSRRRPGFEKNYSRGIRRSRRSFNRLLLTLSPCGRLSSLTSSWMESRATRVHSRCAKFRFSMPRDDPRNRCQFEENFPICI